jgi:hypothetical protein
MTAFGRKQPPRCVLMLSNKKGCHVIILLFAISCSFSVIQANEQISGIICTKPSLNINFEEETQVQMLEHDFNAYEACIIDFAMTANELVIRHKQILDVEVAEESWTAENEQEQLALIEETLQIITAQQEALARAKQDLKDVIAAIVENVPVEVFNQWDVESKVVEP